MDDVDPNQHPLVILLGAICWLLVSLVLYALQFTLVVGILLIPVVLLFVLLDALFELERIIPGWLLFGTMGGLPMLCALVFLERREEENAQDPLPLNYTKRNSYWRRLGSRKIH